MSKRAEEAALKAYPTHKGASKEWIKHYLLGGDCAVFIKGYEQAEKDLIPLAQLWVDSGDANVMSFQQFLKRHETQGNK